VQHQYYMGIDSSVLFRTKCSQNTHTHTHTSTLLILVFYTDDIVSQWKGEFDPRYPKTSRTDHY